MRENQEISNKFKPSEIDGTRERQKRNTHREDRGINRESGTQIEREELKEIERNSRRAREGN